jgi:2-polyprenyl-3-methyl-5-hydroxy-6-metoxy-1,4-benzoquinol methylase
MPETVDRCPLCQHPKSQIFDQREFQGWEVINRICSQCGFVFQSPRMTAVELDDFYARQYRQVYQGEDGPTSKDLMIQEGRADSLLELVRATGHKVNRHLDIGCSSGILLEYFKNNLGCDPVGVEPGQAYRKYACQKGLIVYTSLDEMLSQSEHRFDLISLAHVLEHIPDPVIYLTELRKNILSPSGMILIEVPNLYGHDSFEIAHTSSFSAHSLKETLKRAGFGIVKLIKHGKPRSKLIPLYLTVLAEPLSRSGKGEVKNERFVRLKRKAGMFYRKLALRLLPNKAWLQ